MDAVRDSVVSNDVTITSALDLPGDIIIIGTAFLFI